MLIKMMINANSTNAKLPVESINCKYSKMPLAKLTGGQSKVRAFNDNSKLLHSTKHHENQNPVTFTSICNKSSVEVDNSEAPSEVSLPEKTNLEPNISEFENVLKQVKQQLENTVKENMLLIEKEAKSKKELEKVRKENSALYERYMKMAKDGDVHEEKTLDRENSAEHSGRDLREADYEVQC